MIRIAICDDEVKARHVLKFNLWKVLPDEEKEQVIYEFPSGEKVLSWLRANSGALDVLFLDIEMDGMDGMETAKAIRTFNEELIIIFVTGYADYVFDGYAVGALDYIIKPFSIEKLRDVIKRINIKLYKTEQAIYTVENAQGFFRIPVKDILYFQSDAHKATLVSQARSYEFYRKLDDIEHDLKDGFIRVHQRYLVNASKVERIEDNKVVIDKYEIPMSRSKKKDVMSAFTRIKLEDSDIS